MEATGLFYGHFFENLLRKEIDFINDDIKCIFCTEEYIPDIDNHVFVSDIEGELQESEHYPAGGFSLSNKTIIYNNGETSLDADDLTFYNTTINDIKYIIIYKDTGDRGTSILIGYFDLADIIGITNGDLLIKWSDKGIFVNKIN